MSSESEIEISIYKDIEGFKDRARQKGLLTLMESVGEGLPCMIGNCPYPENKRCQC